MDVGLNVAHRFASAEHTVDDQVHEEVARRVHQGPNVNISWGVEAMLVVENVLALVAYPEHAHETQRHSNKVVYWCYEVRSILLSLSVSHRLVEGHLSVQQLMHNDVSECEVHYSNYQREHIVSEWLYVGGLIGQDVQPGCICALLN